MVKTITVFVGLALIVLAGVGDAQEQERPDFSKPEILQKILGEAMLKDDLEGFGIGGEEFFYVPGSETPYTGWVKVMNAEGKVAELFHRQDGQREGSYTSWYENGQKMLEQTYKDGKLEGVETAWYKNGQKLLEQTYKDGKLEGVATSWYENEQHDDAWLTIEDMQPIDRVMP